MKVLISNNFKALRRGEFVEASEGSSEFILSEDSNYSVATLKEIAEANDVAYKAHDTKAVLLNTLLTHFGEIEMSEQNEASPSVKALPIIEAGIKAKKTDDQIRAEILMATGLAWSAVKKLFNELIEKNNLRISPKVRTDKIEKALAKAKFNPETWTDVQTMAEKFAKEIEDTTETQAILCIRKWVKANDMKMPKKAKEPRKSWREKVFAQIIENPTITEEALAAWVKEQKPEAKNLDKLQEAAVVFMKFARDYYESVSDAPAKGKKKAA